MIAGNVAWGIGGVLAGAVATGAVQGAAEWRQRRLARKAAARVLYGDLFRASDVLETALEQGNWSSLSSLESQDWVDYRDALSAAMPAGAFHTVAGAFYGISTVEHWRLVQPESFAVGSIEDSLVQVTKALDVIFDQGATGRDVRRMVRRAEGHIEDKVRPGSQCLVVLRDRHGPEVAQFLGPAPDDGERTMVRVELDGRRITVPSDAVGAI